MACGTIADMESPEHERSHVIEYLEGQAPDETVEHAEKLASERVFGNEYSVWDVHTDKERWWVVKPLTNLYSQEAFKSMDETLSFHIGLMFRIQASEARKAPDRPEPRLERTRRQWERAGKSLDEADEAEELQAVGVQCRETLLSFVKAMGTDDILPEGAAAPPGGDFIHWGERIADAVAPGDPNEALRRYLKKIAKATWEYVGWLTHNRNAIRIDGAMAVEMVGHVLSLFEQAIFRKERGGPDRCPSCGSYRVFGDQEFDMEAKTVNRIRLCEACDWVEEYEPEPLGPPPLRELPGGECVIRESSYSQTDVSK